MLQTFMKMVDNEEIIENHYEDHVIQQDNQYRQLHTNLHCLFHKGNQDLLIFQFRFHSFFSFHN